MVDTEGRSSPMRANIPMAGQWSVSTCTENTATARYTSMEAPMDTTVPLMESVCNRPRLANRVLTANWREARMASTGTQEASGMIVSMNPV